MPHCCGPSNKKSKQKEMRRPEVKKVREKTSEESLWQKLLRSLGLENKDK